ncbi:autotransporter family protein [Pseudomonas sp. S9]|uniref:autotransporter family protein n=1 Tax=Pseudomonas sp. S9 TaxID=686578 RepID=UPI0002556C93|nr:autotransporter outer membrane beta-barrel domain-containing protein [Pseudomonas sp. S9]
MKRTTKDNAPLTFNLRAGRQGNALQSVSFSALLVLVLGGSSSAYAACVNRPGIGATEGSTCTSAGTSFSSDTINVPIRSSAKSSLTLTAPEVSAEVLPSTPDGNRAVVFARDAALNIEGSLTSILNGAEGTETGQLLRSTLGGSIVVGGDTRLITTQADAIAIDANRGNILLKGNLDAVSRGRAGTSNKAAVRLGQGLRASNGASIRVQGDTQLDVVSRAIEANGTPGSQIELTNLRSRSESFGIIATGEDNAVVVTGEQVDIQVSGDNSEGIYVAEGANVIIDSAGGNTRNAKDSTIVFNTPGASLVTLGDASDALRVQNSSGDARILIGAGTITTGTTNSGYDSEGAFALVRGGPGVAQVDMSGGSILTFAEEAEGIAVQADNNAASRIDNDSIINFSGGSVTTRGNSAVGLLAQSDPLSKGNVTINQSGGSVTTSGTGERQQLSHGILAEATGSGNSTINQSGGTVSTTGNGSHGLYGYSISGDVNINQGATASAQASGENASALVAEAVSPEQRYAIKAAGTLIGGSGQGAGIRTSTQANGSLELGATAKVSAASGIAILDGSGNSTITSAGTITGDILTNAGDDQLNLLAGSVTNGSVIMGKGDDRATIEDGADITRVSLFDGGEGVNDSLSFAGGERNIAADSLQNWETVVLDAGARINFDSPGLSVGSSDNATERGLIINQGATLRARQSSFTVSGDVNNSGTIDLQNNSAGDRFVIATNPGDASGNYHGQDASLKIDTVLGGDNSPTDKLVIQGDSTGSTRLSVNNLGGSGAQTGNGIEVVQVAGNSNGVFALNGDYITKDNQQAVVAGAYAYTLHKTETGDWSLTSAITASPDTPVDPLVPVTPSEPRYSPSAALYQQYGQALLDMNSLPTMQQRVGNRYWHAADGTAQGRTTTSIDGEQTYIENGAGWARVEGSYQRNRPNAGTIDADSTTNRWKMQAGLDALLNEDQQGNKLIGGLTAHYGTSSSQVESFFGDGNIDSRGYGVGLTLTWLQENGFYINSQASATWYKTDIDSDETDHQLASDNDGFGYPFSVESGKQLKLNETLSLTPQAQLIYSKVDFDSFTDEFNTHTSLDSADSLRSRLGVSLDHDSRWLDDTNKIRRSHVYAISNLYYEFLDGTKVDVADVKLKNRPERLWTGLGVGGSYNWNEDKLSLYGEVSVDSSVNNFGDSTAVNGTVGMRLRF